MDLQISYTIYPYQELIHKIFQLFLKFYLFQWKFDQLFFAQHGIDWISDGYPGEGNFLVFNNRNQDHPNEQSAVIEFESIADENGFYPIEDNQPFGPLEFIWFYQDDFFSNIQSGAYRLPNGNTLITVTSQERIFEISYSGEVQWEHSQDIRCARALKYSFDYLQY